MKNKIAWFLTIFLCLNAHFIGAQGKRSMSTKEYIDSFHEFAMQEMRNHGVPASITLGQGILESASGNSRLSKECNNHFGIKCRREWKGRFCLADDDAKDECFRGYESAYESYRDHSLFLKNSRRYDFLFELKPLNYKGWAHGLRKAGYATNPAYGNILTRIIEKYSLAHYDSIVVLGKEVFEKGPSEVLKVNGIPAVAAKAGDSPESIAKEQKLAKWKIYKYNDLEKNDLINPGEILYLKPKRKSADESIHIIKRGETLHDVSQMYAIKMKYLRKLNQLNKGEEPVIGEEISLSKKRNAPPKVAKGKVPMSTAVKVLHSASRSNDQTHEVLSGETIESIAEKYKTSVLNLVRWNDLEYAEVKPGQVLVLAPGIKSSADVRSVSKEEVVLRPNTHTVMRGETVYSIARMYKMSPSQIVEYNDNLRNGGNLLADQIIWLVPKDKTGETQKASIHFVKPGETLFSISRKYQITVDALRSINNLSSNTIWVGQKIRIP
ncbi:LysM peptidoglycan-binding domain-containing protein [Bacteroidia bacterium]|nr:LysM peptidoglycan-binding domain-containing protein [Bacteroidia bacterium]